MSFDICNSGEKEVACVETVSRIMFKALPMLGRVVLRGRVYRYSWLRLHDVIIDEAFVLGWWRQKLTYFIKTKGWHSIATAVTTPTATTTSSAGAGATATNELLNINRLNWCK